MDIKMTDNKESVKCNKFAVKHIGVHGIGIA